VLTDINGTGTLGPITFLAALGNPAASNLPGPVSGALDSSLFSVTPNGLGVTVSWDLIGTGYTLAYVLVETDFTAGVHPPHHLAQYDVWRSNQHIEVAQGSQFVDNFFNHGVPVSHVSFYGGVSRSGDG
jgi:hypothetical protein